MSGRYYHIGPHLHAQRSETSTPLTARSTETLHRTAAQSSDLQRRRTDDLAGILQGAKEGRIARTAAINVLEAYLRYTPADAERLVDGALSKRPTGDDHDDRVARVDRPTPESTRIAQVQAEQRAKFAKLGTRR